MLPVVEIDRDGAAARRFRRGEVWPLDRLPASGARLSFVLSPDAENPRRAVILTVGDVVLTLDGFQLRLSRGADSVRHPAVLDDGFYHPVTLIASEGFWQLTVRGEPPVELPGPLPDAPAVFGATEPAVRFRGRIKDVDFGGFSGPRPAVPPPPVPRFTELRTDGATPTVIPLEGEWEFFCTPKSFAPDAPLPDPGLYTARMTVPGYWDDHYDLIRETRSFDRSARTNPRYRPFSLPMGELTPDATTPFLVATGYYRKLIRFAPGSRPAGVALELGPAVWGATVYCNGVRAGGNPGYSTGTTAALDGLLDPEGINTIILAVSNFDRVFGESPQENSQHIGLAVRGYQGMRAGIGGYCRLRLTGAARFDDVHVHFDGTALRCVAETSGAAGEVRWRLLDPDGGVAGTAVGEAAAIPAAALRRWSDRDPWLYTVEATLCAGGEVSDFRSFRYGLRQLETSGQRIRLNGRPVYFRGLTEHHYFPETANAPFDKEKYRRDITAWRELGFNFLRFHTWCPPEPYLEAADELGMLCQVEVPPHTDPAEWTRILKLLRRHPAAAIVCGGNEEDFTAERLAEVRELAALTRKFCPGMLFNPQEALSKVEYRLLPDAPGVVTEPFIHDPKKLAALGEFSDVYGSYSWGFFSYIHTRFTDPEEIDRRCAVLGKPLLSHEIGIIGGWLDFANAARYRNTVVPGEVYTEAQRYLEQCGLFSRAREFYEFNCAAVNRQRKAMLENVRRCRNLAGFDYLGAYDAHWHRCGYPCGILDEFNAPKPGIDPAEFRRINGETVLLCDAPYGRAAAAGAEFAREFTLSHFGPEPLTGSALRWQARAGGFRAAGENAVPTVAPGDVVPVGRMSLTLPPVTKPTELVLEAELTAPGGPIRNQWSFWIFPVPEAETRSGAAIETDRLTPELVAALAAGANVLLTGHFPTPRTREKFQCATAGRATGHFGTIIPSHPLLAEMAPAGFADWQFFHLLDGAAAMDFTASPLPFRPLIEYIPSFKLARRKTPLCEMTVGRGRLLMCGLRFESFDPAARYLHARMLDYLASAAAPQAPAVPPETLKSLLEVEFPDNGIAKTDEAWDPNVSGGKRKL